MYFFFFSSRRRHTRLTCDWSSDVCSSDLRGIYKGLFVGIGSPLRALAEIKRELGRASRLSHPLSSWLENREQMFSVALSIASWSMFVNAFGLSDRKSVV